MIYLGIKLVKDVQDMYTENYDNLNTLKRTYINGKIFMFVC